jgi:hypothetical protein
MPDPYDAFPIDEEGRRNAADLIRPRCIASLVQKRGKRQTVLSYELDHLCPRLGDVDGEDDEITAPIRLVAVLES